MYTYKHIHMFAAAVFCFAAALCPAIEAETQSEQSVALPTGFQNITLGMDAETTKNALKDNALFGYRGERDVSLTPDTRQPIIQTDGGPYSYLRQCWFQFHNDILYIMTLNLNQEKTDYYSLFSTLCKKYGEPTALTPNKCEWRNETVILTLERPLALKYTDAKIFTSLQENAQVQKTAVEQDHDHFLESL